MLGDIEKSGKSGDEEFNQPIDNVNAQRVDAMRDANIDTTKATLTEANTAIDDYNTKAEQFIKDHGDAEGRISEKHADQIRATGEILTKNATEAYDGYIGAIDAHNYSADSTNVANQNAKARAEADFQNVFKQMSRGNERRLNRAGRKQEKARRKISKANYAVEEANRFMIDNTRPGTGPMTGQRVYDASDKKTKRKMDRKQASVERKKNRADRAIGRANKATERYNKKMND